MKSPDLVCLLSGLAAFMLVPTPLTAEDGTSASEPGAKASASEASAWQQSFDAERLAEHLDIEGWRFIVVAADEREASRAAVEAMEQSLQQRGARRVIEDASLEEMNDTKDTDILDSLADQPADRFVLVRTFADADSAPPRAVVTVYNAAGDTVTGLTTRRGQRLPEASSDRSSNEGSDRADEREDSSDDASEGVSEEASDRIASIAERQQSDRQEALETFRRKFLSLKNITVVNASGRTVNRVTRIRRGERREQLDGQAFYEIVGRDDLADQYATRRKTRTALYVMGGVTGVSALGLLLSPLFQPSYRSAADDVAQSPPSLLNNGAFIGGLLLEGVSLGTILAGASMNLHPVSASEQRRMAKEYNERIKRELGLPSDVSGARPGSSSQKMDYSLRPRLIDDGIGAAFRLRF